MEPQRRIVKKRREKEEKGEKKIHGLEKILTLHVASQNIHWKATLSAKLWLTHQNFIPLQIQSFKHFATLYLAGIGKIQENGAQIKCWQRYQPIFTHNCIFSVALHSTLHTLWWCALPREKRLSAILGVKKKKNLQHQKRWITFSFKGLKFPRKIRHFTMQQTNQTYSSGIRLTTNGSVFRHVLYALVLNKLKKPYQNYNFLCYMIIASSGISEIRSH